MSCDHVRVPASDHVHPLQHVPRETETVSPSQLKRLGVVDPIMLSPDGWKIKLAEAKVPKGTTYAEAGLHPRGWGMWHDEVHGAGVYEAMEKGLIDAPVTVHRGMLADGNHRVASAMALQRKGKKVTMNVVHEDTLEVEKASGKSSRGLLV